MAAVQDKTNTGQAVDYNQLENEILKKEEQFKEEKSEKIRSRLLNEIRNLSERYSKRNESVSLVVDKINHHFGPGMVPQASRMLGKKIITNLQNQQLAGLKCSELLIEDSKNIASQIMEVNGSLLIRNVQSSTIRSIAEQVRIKDCSNLELEIWTETGVYLENSTNISIQPLSCKRVGNNLYRNVIDFTSPSAVNKNYRFAK